jgi:hypothetical protein
MLIDSPGFPPARERQGGKIGNDKGDKLEMTGDMSTTCYYNVLTDSGLIGKFDLYLSFLRRQESSQEKIIDKGIERLI